jgi:hypothetical protein
MNTLEVDRQCKPLMRPASTQSDLIRWIRIGCCLQITGWLRGRLWVLADVDLPSNGQTACCTILLSQGDMSIRQSLYQSLSDHTDIISRLDGFIEARAYSPSVFPFAIGYIKISAPEEFIGQVATTVRHHLGSSFPSVRPEFRLGFASQELRSSSGP